MSSPILVKFGLGAPPQAYMHIAPGKKVGTATWNFFAARLGGAVGIGGGGVA